MVLVNLYSELEEKDSLYVDKNNKIAPPAYTPFVEQGKGINRSPMLNSFKGPFELLHAVIKILAKSVVDTKYCLLFVDLFTSKIYTYPMKNRILKKMKFLIMIYQKIKSMNKEMRIQTDQ